jgi:LytS/YehU family sensor histidine kinase
VDPEFGEQKFYEWAIVGSIWVVNYFIFALAYYYFTSLITKKNVLVTMIEERSKKENEHLELENALLRAQINPHFLYNSLNFLYAKSLPLSKELSDSILRLSEIMRYSLQAQDSDGLVSLVDEVAHIRNLIEMARLRFNNGIFVELSLSEHLNGHKIVPLVFVTLVENVLKHGRLNDETHPAAIRMELSEGQELKFTTWNFKRTGPKESSTGIGLRNTIRRLEEAYGDLCTISIIDAKESFQTSIKVPLASHNISALT